MTAIISNISDYRAPAAGTAFQHYTDGHLMNRVGLLEMVQSGRITSDTPSASLYKSVFPNGYDPANRPEDYLVTVKAELARRLGTS